VKRDHWREDAACVGLDGDIFFPYRNNPETRWDEAKAICKRCRVKKQCLDLVINLEEHDDRWGVFGGLNPLERKELRIKLRRKA